MYCGGGHLGFPICINNINFVEDLPMIIPGQFGFNCQSVSLTFDPMGKMFQNASSLKLLEQLKPNCPGMIIGRSSANFMLLRWRPSWISDRHKKYNFVEDLPMIIPGQFGFNCPSGFREEAF
jgi:hypothetical protein